jgi:hypothetical protein
MVPTFNWGTSADFDITRFTIEAWFHLNGYINPQNTRVWEEENPHEIHTEPLNLEKIEVYCVLSALWQRSRTAS